MFVTQRGRVLHVQPNKAQPEWNSYLRSSVPRANMVFQAGLLLCDVFEVKLSWLFGLHEVMCWVKILCRVVIMAVDQRCWFEWSLCWMGFGDYVQ